MESPLGCDAPVSRDGAGLTSSISFGRRARITEEKSLSFTDDLEVSDPYTTVTNEAAAPVLEEMPTFTQQEAHAFFKGAVTQQVDQDDELGPLPPRIERGRALMRSSAGTAQDGGPGSQELFSFKMREKVATAQADNRSTSPTLWSSKRTADSDSLSTRSDDGMRSDDISKQSGMLLRTTPHLMPFRTSSLSSRATEHLRAYPPGMLPRKVQSASNSISNSISSRDSSPPHCYRSPLSSSSGLKSSSPNDAAHGYHLSKPRSASMTATSYGAAFGTTPPCNSRQLAETQQRHISELYDASKSQLHAHAMVYARAKGISIEEACQQLAFKQHRQKKTAGRPPVA